MDPQTELIPTDPDAPAAAPAPPAVEVPTTPTPAEGEADVLAYLDEHYRTYGLQQIARTQPVSYFLPLLHELFGGGEAKTRVLFTMLHRLMVDDRVRWTRGELDERFHWLKEGHRSYLLYRLSNVGWLEYYRDQGVYMISDKGEALMRMLSRFSLGAELVENEGAALAEIEFSLLLDLDDLPERLQFLRNRLLKHAIRAEHALESDSAYRILEIYQQLKNAYRWAEQTRKTLDHLEVDSDESPNWVAIRGVHQHLSKLHALIARMQVVLQEIQHRQIDIARFGLTQLDFDNYLINASADVLSVMMKRHLQKVPHPFFLIEANAFDEAREILGRPPATAGTPRGWDTAVSEAAAEGARAVASETEAFAAALARVPKRWTPVQRFVQDVTWEVAAYRYSLLTLLADLDPRAREAAETSFDPLINVPVLAEFDMDAELDAVTCADEERRFTPGRLRRVGASAAEATADEDTEPAGPAGAAPAS